MTTTMMFESAALADAVKKAAQIAPAKSGMAFDKAAGIVLDVFPDEEVSCIIRATDMNIFYSEVVSSLESSGPQTRWRLSSHALTAVVSGLPASAGKVTFKQDGNKIVVTSGRMRASLVLMDSDYYPEWDMFDSSGMSAVTGMGGKIAQVEWAASKGADFPWCGVYLNGTHAIATDRYRLCSTPLAIPLPHPIIVPAGVLGTILRKVGDTEVALDGTVLNVAPDSYTQIRTTLLGGDYPPVERIMRRDYPQSVNLKKSHLIDVLKRASQFAGADRDPVIRTFWGKGEVAAMMDNPEIGMLGDVVEVPGQIEHKRVTLWFAPKYILDGLERAASENITIKYDDQNPLAPVYIDGGGGQEIWIVPRKEPRGSSDE